MYGPLVHSTVYMCVTHTRTCVSQTCISDYYSCPTVCRVHVMSIYVSHNTNHVCVLWWCEYDNTQSTYRNMTTQLSDNITWITMVAYIFASCRNAISMTILWSDSRQCMRFFVENTNQFENSNTLDFRGSETLLHSEAPYRLAQERNLRTHPTRHLSAWCVGTPDQLQCVHSPMIWVRAGK